jgi:hypothetical protein
MAKKKKTKGIVIELPDDFNRKLKIMVIALDELGVKTTRQDLIIKYAQIGYNQEVNHDR